MATSYLAALSVLYATRCRDLPTRGEPAQAVVSLVWSSEQASDDCGGIPRQRTVIGTAILTKILSAYRHRVRSDAPLHWRISGKRDPSKVILSSPAPPCLTCSAELRRVVAQPP